MSLNCRGCFVFVDPTHGTCHQLSENVENLQITLQEVFFCCTGLNLQAESMVCSICYEKLNSFYLFQKQINEIDHRFREIEEQEELILDIKIEQESEIIEDEVEIEDAMKLWNDSPNNEEFTKNEIYECPECPGKYYQNAIKLENHINQVHVSKPFECDLCGKRFVRLENIRDHMRNSHLKKEICDICKKVNHDVRKHKRIVHGSERPYVCSICGTRCKTTNSLSMHIETHNTSEYSCKYCPKKFNRVFNLNIHTKKMHTNPSRDHKCYICSKGFKRNTHLQDHIATHSDETPFTCEKCENSYKTKLALYNHVKTKHNIEVK